MNDVDVPAPDADADAATTSSGSGSIRGDSTQPALSQAAILKIFYDATKDERYNKWGWGTPNWSAGDSVICDQSNGWYGVTCVDNEITGLVLGKCNKMMGTGGDAAFVGHSFGAQMS